MNLAVFLPNWVGDAVMATPTLRALRSLAGVRGRLVAVLRPHIAEVLAGVESLDEQILFDPHSRDSELGSWSVIKQLRPRSPDAIVLLDQFAAHRIDRLGDRRARARRLRAVRTRDDADHQAPSAAPRPQADSDAGDRQLFAIGLRDRRAEPGAPAGSENSCPATKRRPTPCGESLPCPRATRWWCSIPAARSERPNCGRRNILANWPGGLPSATG